MNAVLPRLLRVLRELCEKLRPEEGKQPQIPQIETPICVLCETCWFLLFERVVKDREERARACARALLISALSFTFSGFVYAAICSAVPLLTVRPPQSVPNWTVMALPPPRSLERFAVIGD